MRILFALAGLHRVDRGAEVAFIEIAKQLSLSGHQVTLFGSGSDRSDEPYRFVHVPAVRREKFERWPTFPALRNETGWEEATFAPGLLAKYRPVDYEIVATCAYPFTYWALRHTWRRGNQPKRVFITQNGDWPAYSDDGEFRFFTCDGLVCTNPDYFERNRTKYRCALIPNGVDLDRFAPGKAERARFGLPNGRIVLMVSALIPSKNIKEGISAVAGMDDVTLVVAGDGPMREELREQAAEMLPGRFRQLTVVAADMPTLYRSADAFMHLSVDESFGNVFVEAMASGLPIIAYDTPRTRWIIGEAANLAKSRDPEALRLAISHALDEPATSRSDMRSRSLLFDWPAIAKKYESFFMNLLDE